MKRGPGAPAPGPVLVHPQPPQTAIGSPNTGLAPPSLSTPLFLRNWRPTPQPRYTQAMWTYPILTGDPIADVLLSWAWGLLVALALLALACLPLVLLYALLAPLVRWWRGA